MLEKFEDAKLFNNFIINYTEKILNSHDIDETNLKIILKEAFNKSKENNDLDFKMFNFRQFFKNNNSLITHIMSIIFLNNKELN